MKYEDIDLCDAIIGEFTWGVEKCLEPAIGQFEDDEGKLFDYCEKHDPFN